MALVAAGALAAVGCSAERPQLIPSRDAQAPGEEELPGGGGEASAGAEESSLGGEGVPSPEQGPNGSETIGGADDDTATEEQGNADEKVPSPEQGPNGSETIGGADDDTATEEQGNADEEVPSPNPSATTGENGETQPPVEVAAPSIEDFVGSWYNYDAEAAYQDIFGLHVEEAEGGGASVRVHLVGISRGFEDFGVYGAALEDDALTLSDVRIHLNSAQRIEGVSVALGEGDAIRAVLKRCTVFRFNPPSCIDIAYELEQP